MHFLLPWNTKLHICGLDILRLPLLSPVVGVIRQSHWHLDGGVSALCILCPFGVCSRKLCVKAAQRAPAVPAQEEEEQGKSNAAHSF